MLRTLFSIVTLLALVASSAQAALVNGSGFNFSISEKEMVLVHDLDSNNPSAFSQEDFDEIIHYVAWDNSPQRVLDRNMPYVEISNFSASSAPITGIQLTVGDTRYNFASALMGTAAKLATSDSGISIASATSSGDTLNITFGGSGIPAGSSARFQIDLDVDPGQTGLFATPDFRKVLFDMNGASTADNAIVTAIFGDTPSTSLSKSVDDYTVTGPQALYYNNIRRPYGVMEGVDVFGTAVPVSVPVLTTTPAKVDFATSPLGLANGGKLPANTMVTLANAVALQNTGTAGTIINVTGFEIVSAVAGDAAMFQLSFSPTTLVGGEAAKTYDVKFLGANPGLMKTATLRFFTDIGTSIDIGLMAMTQTNTIPEPGTLVLASLAALAGVMIRRRAA